MSDRDDLLVKLGVEASCEKVLEDCLSKEYKDFCKRIDVSPSITKRVIDYYAFNVYNPRLNRTATFHFNFSISKEICSALFEFLIRSCVLETIPIS